MMPGNYQPQGRVHIILHRLSQGEARKRDLYEAMGWVGKSASRDVLAAHADTISHLIDVGLAVQVPGQRPERFAITEAGRAVLAELDALEPLRPVTAPVFPSRLARMMAGASA